MRTFAFGFTFQTVLNFIAIGWLKMLNLKPNFHRQANRSTALLRLLLSALYSIIPFFISTPAVARTQDVSECTNVMVDTTFMPQNNDQRNMDTCYAFATANLLSFYAHKPLSPFHLAALSTKDMANGGTMTEIIESLRQPGVFLCEEKDYLKKFSNWNDANTYYETLLRSQTDPSHRAGSYPQKVNARDTILGICRNKVSVPWAHIQNLQWIQRPQEYDDGISTHDVISTTSAPFGKITVDLLEEANLKKLAVLNQILSRREPVAIGYQMKYLAPKDGNHMSVLIGRRWNHSKLKCEYLIKNSWGNKPSPLLAQYESNLGNFWVEGEILEKAVFDITFLSKTAL